MTPGQRHVAWVSACATPLIAYQAREVSQRDDGWPISRFLGLLPLWLFLTILGGFNSWFCPHIVRKILRRMASKAAAALEALDIDRPTFDTEE